MFALKLLLLFFGVTTIQAATLEDARAELELAKNTVYTLIRSADSRLNSYHDRFKTNSQNSLTEGEFILKFEEQTFFGQVAAVEELGQLAGVDVSSCFDYPEHEVLNLTTVLTRNFQMCVSNELVAGLKMFGEYIYLTDIQINPILHVEYQLRFCDVDSEECITPLYDQIIWEKLYRREIIDISLINANYRFNQLTATVQECQNINVDQYMAYVQTLLNQIHLCADSLLV